MSLLARRLIYFVGGVLVFAAVTSALALTVTYKPWGVPDSRRAEYEEKIAELEQRKALLESSDERAVAKFDKKVHDFGRLDPHSTASHTFMVENAGDSPLSVTLRETSCKCTVGKLGNSVLLPGEKTDITLTWNTGYKAEEYEQTAIIQTNDPLKKTVTLKVKGSVRADLVIPARINLPNSDRGDVAKNSAMIYSQLWDDFLISDVQSEEIPDLEWYAEPMKLNDPKLADLEPKSAWRLVVEVPMLAAEVKGRATITIEPSTGEQIQRTIQIAGRTRSPIAFFHPMIDDLGLDIGTLNSTDKGHEIPMSVRVRGAYRDRKLAVLDVKPDALQAKLEKGAEPGLHRLTVIIPPNCPFVSFNRTDEHGYVQVGDPDDTTLQNWFPLYGAVVEIPD